MGVVMLSIALAVALTYAVGDLYGKFLPTWLAWIVDGIVCLVLYKVTHHYLQNLKE